MNSISAPRPTAAIKVLSHAFGRVTDKFTTAERKRFPGYLADQIFCPPDPEELVRNTDSGKGRKP